MRDGLDRAAGLAAEFFERPATRFVAAFWARPNELRTRQARPNRRGNITMAVMEACAADASRRTPGHAAPDGTQVLLGIRPEHIGSADGASPRFGNGSDRGDESNSCSRQARAHSPPFASAAPRQWRNSRRMTSAIPARRLHLISTSIAHRYSTPQVSALFKVD